MMKLIDLKIKKACLLLFVLASVFFMGSQVCAAEEPYVSEPVTPNVFDGDLSQFPTAEAWEEGEPEYEVPILETVPGGDSQGGQGGQGETESRTMDATDATGQAVQSPTLMPAPIVNFEGISFTGYTPPDTNGDVGPHHYIQIVNSKFAIYNKAGALLAGPFNINTLWAGFGGNCETDNDGDPIVLYDHLADRWLISQFVAFTNQCIAISKTPDPVAGGWWLYDFPTGGVSNDYPKFGVWPDAYYMGSQRGYGGAFSADAWAFNRTRMLAGLPATFQRFNQSGQFLLPSDLDGWTPPPASAPNVFGRLVDGAEFGGADRLELYAFHVDWANPALSTFTALPALPVAAFDRNFCGTYNLLVACTPQPGTAQKLETLSAWLMYRLQYRNRGSHETLVVNHTVDVGGDHAGIRWYELRKGAGAWSIFQQGTYAPDAHHRWMGSLAMDHSGNMALGYSISSGVVQPSIRYTGRLATDPLGTTPQGETVIIAGAAPQTHSFRWGDYSSMSVDPTDDCTFWYTQEYVTNSAARWRTRIASFKFPSCGWRYCIKDVAYTTQYWLNLEFKSRLVRGQAKAPSSGFPAPITGTYKVNPNELLFSVDYLNQTGLRFYRISLPSKTGETWGIYDADSSYYDGPRAATIEFCPVAGPESAEGESGAME